MKVLQRILPLILFLGVNYCYAQYHSPSESSIYSDIDLPRIDITLDQDDLDFILAPENRESDEEFPAKFTYRSNLRNDSEENIGFRLRGNTSRASGKQSFKVSFNSFKKGRDLDGFEKLNLNGSSNDPSITRTKIAWDLMNERGVISPRANLVELYVNEEYRGVYTNVEHIDEEFIEERFGNKNGNLFKCLYPADLNYKGTNPNLYKEEFFGRQAYELKTNEELDDYTGLAIFIQILNRSSTSEFQKNILEVFDVYSYLKALALETLIGHWDNYGINQNNFYLYENLEGDGRFYYIPFDLDNTLGVDFFDVDWADRDIYKWYSDRDDRPLTQKILSVPIFREEYTRIVDDLLKTQFNPSILNARIDELKSQIQNAAERDVYRTFDYGFTIDDFNNSYDVALDDHNHVRYGLKEFISRRYEQALLQIDEVVFLNADKKSIGVNISPNPVNDKINLEVPNLQSDYMVSIYSLDGILLERLTHQTKSLSMTHSLKTGVYLLLVQSNGLQVSKKLIIK